jgi:hypothetical protein
MEIINVVKQETIYTLNFTEEELKVILAVLARSSNESVKETLHDEEFYSEFNTANYTDYEVEHAYRIYTKLADLLMVKTGG